MNPSSKTSASGCPTADEALRKGADFLRSLGVESPRLEMEIILAEVLELDRVGLYMNLERRLMPDERDASRDMLARRRNREPLAYILGRREFYGFTFGVSPDVLVPRPETELIVDLVMEWTKNRSADVPALLADIGAGSGAIAIACALLQADRDVPARWIATDVSPAALAVARENAAMLGAAGLVEFREGSLYDPLTEPVDLIASNPPYVAEFERESLMPDVLQYEPASALFSGPEGLDHLKPLIEGAPERLRPGGLLLLEIGKGQKPAVERIFERTSGFDAVSFHPDLAGIPRVVRAVRTP